jgi:hypothetical protein
MAAHFRAGQPDLSGSPGIDMRLVTIYLSGYFLLIVLALASLWYGGVLWRLPVSWVIIGLIVAAGFGVTLFLTAGKPVARD